MKLTNIKQKELAKINWKKYNIFLNLVINSALKRKLYPWRIKMKFQLKAGKEKYI